MYPFMTIHNNNNDINNNKIKSNQEYLRNATRNVKILFAVERAITRLLHPKRKLQDYLPSQSAHMTKYDYVS